jgi:exopolyphosphatase/guanosine-5'-triphosphate,3'-diphosphate pyrophosphatase
VGPAHGVGYDALIEPRYEFRVWDRRLDEVAAHIRSHSECHEERWSTELYMVCRDCIGVNLKARKGLLDLKTLQVVADGCEQWAPGLKAEFPVPAATARDALRRLGVSPSVVSRDAYSIDEFIGELVEPHPLLAAVTVTKRRYAFTVGGCITELASVVISGTALETVAVEAVDLDAVRVARGLLGLDRYENVSYPTHIKRMLGWDSRHSAAVR